MKNILTRPFFFGSVVLIVIVVGIVVMWHRSSNTTIIDNKKLKIVAAENFWGNITSQIGGDKVTVTSIISDPHADPHLYESDARTAAAVSTANIVIKNGAGYDAFIDKLLSASPSSQRQVVSIDKVINVTGADPNPHLWYDIPRILQVTTAMEQALAIKDPVDSAIFVTNLATFNHSLKPIIETIQQIKSKYPHAPVAYTERVPGYLLAEAGLEIKTPLGFAAAIEQGNDPSPRDTAIMEALMTNHSIRVLLYNAQTTSAITQRIRYLANQAHIPVIGVTETLPATEPTYQSWQLNQTRALLQALGG